MPEDITSQPTAVAAPTPAPPASDPSVRTPAPPDANREAIIARYEQQFAPPVDTTSVVADPVAPPAAPAAPPVDPRDAQIAALQASLVEIQNALKPQAPAAPVTPTETPADWLGLLASGNKEQGEAALAALMKNKIGKEIIDAAVNQANERVNLEREITSFNAEIRSTNPDVVPMEQYITFGVTNRLQNWLQANPNPTSAAYVKAYKESVQAEVESSRQLIQTFRGAGRQEAITRTTVLSGQPVLAPTPVNTSREAPTTQEAPVESPSDYLARRASAKAAGQGMAFAT